MENPKVNLILDIPAQRMFQCYISNNEEMAEQIKIGIDNAVKYLCEKDNLAKMVENEVYEKLKESFNKWTITVMLNELIEKRLSKYIEDKAKEFAEKIINKIESELI